MKFNFIVFSISTALNKGASLLFFPLLISFLTVEEYGLWTLVFLAANMISSLLSLGGGASVLRESSDKNDKEQSLFLTLLYTLFSTLIFVVLYSLLYALGLSDKWYSFALLYGFCLSVLSLFSAFYRGKNRLFLYLFNNVAVVVFLLTVITFSLFEKVTIEQLFIYQAYAYFIALVLSIILFLLFLRREISSLLRLKVREQNKKLDIRSSMLFSISLLPHNLSQWALSSSDRFIISALLGNVAAGIYSIAYNFGQVLMLLNSGIALTLQPYMIRNYSKWNEENLTNKLFHKYTVAALLIHLVTLIFMLVDNSVSLLGITYDVTFISIFHLIYLSLYFMGAYYFYVNYIFYHKKGSIISKLTMLVCAFSVVSAALLGWLIGLLGVALANLLSYVLYYVLAKNSAVRIDSNSNSNLNKCFYTFLFFSTASFLLANLFIK
ncbi:oligosaccharide flippase family protein [Pseudoalteromonas tetraodonis]|uniref:lipopolysaccharide biosynthesis protein n=1 Tax=Pseudoalteromonas tetraodonis TaxID=43659 RepID=UPI001BDE1EC7|nr:oligosaccharide flippase family protein [Pseudoalteromonas tetraodonis]MBT2152931.1 oligosaccharide flippase family protein [Pseudoalteromonas tetraodonis]